MLPSFILTYHAIEVGPPPLCVDPSVFRAHLDCILDAGARTVGIAELAAQLGSGPLREQTVAITFDDGFASVADVAAEDLTERELTATVFCVADHVGGTNEWPSARHGGFVGRLANASALRGLAYHGIEIGSHGATHAPLTGEDRVAHEHEVRDSRAVLEAMVEAPVRSFAYPYGAAPSAAARSLVEETYAAACTTRLATLSSASDLHGLPRIDAHYVREPSLLQRALDGSLGPYLRARGLGARARRALRKDYARVA